MLTVGAAWVKPVMIEYFVMERAGNYTNDFTDTIK
jgi:hypothetical protein